LNNKTRRKKQQHHTLGTVINLDRKEVERDIYTLNTNTNVSMKKQGLYNVYNQGLYNVYNQGLYNVYNQGLYNVYNPFS